MRRGLQEAPPTGHRITQIPVPLVRVFVVTTTRTEQCGQLVRTEAHVLHLVARQRSLRQLALLVLQLYQVVFVRQGDRTNEQAEQTSRIRCSTVSGTHSFRICTAFFWPNR